MFRVGVASVFWINYTVDTSNFVAIITVLWTSHVRISTFCITLWFYSYFAYAFPSWLYQLTVNASWLITIIAFLVSSVDVISANRSAVRTTSSNRCATISFVITCTVKILATRYFSIITPLVDCCDVISADCGAVGNKINFAYALVARIFHAIIRAARSVFIVTNLISTEYSVTAYDTAWGCRP